MSDGFIVDDVFAAVFAVEDRNRHAPDTLTGNAPVTAVVDHIVNAVMAPGRNPFDRVDGIEGFLAEAVDRSEPLFRSAVDDRFLATPAVRILMAERALGKEGAQFSQFLDDRYVRVEDELAFKAGNLVGVTARAVDCAQRLEAPGSVFLADIKVVLAMVRSGMDEAGTSFESDVVAEDDGDFTVIEGMLEDQAFELFARHDVGQDFVVVDFAGFHGRFDQVFGHEQVFVADAYPDVFKVFVGTDGDVAGNGPRRRRPDEGEDFVRVGTFRHMAAEVDGLEFDVNGEGFIILVFDFSFSQGRFAVRAPVNGLQAFVDVAFLGHFPEDADLSDFDGLAQRQVRMVPVTEDAEADEVFLLFFHAGQGVVTAFGTQVEGGHFVAVEARIFDDGVFDRQAVRIPAGNVFRVAALLGLIFEDNVF